MNTPQKTYIPEEKQAMWREMSILASIPAYHFLQRPDMIERLAWLKAQLSCNTRRDLVRILTDRADLMRAWDAQH